MSPEDIDDVDPGVLADPLEDEGSLDDAAEVEATPSGSATADEPTLGTQLASPIVATVPLGARSLAPVDPFRRYLQEIARYPPLDREEELELARRYRETGDRAALFRLVTANLMLVVRIALSFRRAARNLLDLVQEGNLGLLKAIERFDPDIGARLATYAGWWIRAYMVKFLLDNVRMVRVGTTNARRKLLRNLHREHQRLEAEGYDVGPRLLAEHFGVSVEDVRDVQQALQSRDVSLDEPLSGTEDRVRGDLLADGRRPASRRRSAVGSSRSVPSEPSTNSARGCPRGRSPCSTSAS